MEQKLAVWRMALPLAGQGQLWRWGRGAGGMLGEVSCLGYLFRAVISSVTTTWVPGGKFKALFHGQRSEERIWSKSPIAATGETGTWAARRMQSFPGTICVVSYSTETAHVVCC